MPSLPYSEKALPSLEEIQAQRLSEKSGGGNKTTHGWRGSGEGYLGKLDISITAEEAGRYFDTSLSLWLWQLRYPVTRGKQISLLASRKRTQETTHSQPHLSMWEGDRATLPGNYFQACKEQGSDWE